MGDHSAPLTVAERVTEAQPATLLTRWRATEPVRLYAYGVTIPVLGLLTGYGVLTQVQAGLWLAVAGAALLATGLSAELARRDAWSEASVEQLATRVRSARRRERVHHEPTPAPTVTDLAAIRHRRRTDTVALPLPRGKDAGL